MIFFIQENESEKIVSKLTAILSQSQWVKTQWEQGNRLMNFVLREDNNSLSQSFNITENLET